MDRIKEALSLAFWLMAFWRFEVRRDHIWIRRVELGTTRPTYFVNYVHSFLFQPFAYEKERTCNKIYQQKCPESERHFETMKMLPLTSLN